MSSTNAADLSERDRQKLYKNAGKSDDVRRRRAENSVELRKQRRQEDLTKRRQMTTDDENEEPTSPPLLSMDGNAHKSTQSAIVGETPKKSRPALSIDEIVALLQQPQPTMEQLRTAFESLRRLLSSSAEPPMEEIIAAGLLGALVTGLAVPDEKVQVEAAWALTNVLSGSTEHTEAAIKAGCVEPLIQLCKSESRVVAEQALWAITNVAGESIECRDHLISLGLPEILAVYVERVDQLAVSMVRTLAWTYSNLVRHKKPQLPVHLLAKLAPGIAALLKNTDSMARQDACWALSYLTDGSDENLELAMKQGVIEGVVSMLAGGENSSIAPAIRVLGNFSTGCDELTQVVIDTGILSTLLPPLFDSPKTAIVKEACWLVSNVMAGTNEQIQAVLDANLLQPIIKCLNSGDSRVQFEASWAVANLIHGGTASQILATTHVAGGLEAICRSLSLPNTELVYNMLEALHKILITTANCAPKNLDTVKLRIEEADGLDYLEQLQQHELNHIYDAAFKIVEEFFNDDSDVEDDEGETPATFGDQNSQSAGVEGNGEQPMFQF